MNRSRGVADPRPDLRRDSLLWSKLLALAWGPSPDPPDPEGLWGPLHGLRCMGAALVVTSNSVVMRRGEIPEAEYQENRAQWLTPYEAGLIAMLAELGKGQRLRVIPQQKYGGNHGKETKRELETHQTRG